PGRLYLLVRCPRSWPRGERVSKGGSNETSLEIVLGRCRGGGIGRGCAGGGIGASWGCAKRGGAPDGAFDRVRQGSVWSEREGAVCVRRRPWLDQPLLWRLCGRVAAAPDQRRASARRRPAAQAAPPDHPH